MIPKNGNRLSEKIMLERSSPAFLAGMPGVAAIHGDFI